MDQSTILPNEDANTTHREATSLDSNGTGNEEEATTTMEPTLWTPRDGRAILQNLTTLERNFWWYALRDRQTILEAIVDQDFKPTLSEVMKAIDIYFRAVHRHVARPVLLQCTCLRLWVAPNQKRVDQLKELAAGIRKLQTEVTDTELASTLAKLFYWVASDMVWVAEKFYSITNLNHRDLITTANLSKCALPDSLQKDPTEWIVPRLPSSRLEELSDQDRLQAINLLEHRDAILITATQHWEVTEEGLTVQGEYPPTVVMNTVTDRYRQIYGSSINATVCDTVRDIIWTDSLTASIANLEILYNMLVDCLTEWEDITTINTVNRLMYAIECDQTMLRKFRDGEDAVQRRRDEIDIEALADDINNGPFCQKLLLDDEEDDDQFATEFQGWRELCDDDDAPHDHDNNNREGRQRSGVTDSTNESHEGGD